jgi:CRISPR-associated endonuclease/helicase Cas3
MRVLVEQTRDNTVLWLRRLDLLGGAAQVVGSGAEERVRDYTPSWSDPNRIAVSVLMGGEDDGEWDLYPERDAILIGTQDMLLSRALNRGYAMSRYRWPVHFGLLNNDCLWVADEVQLMGNGLASTTQLQAFGRRLGTLGARHTVWMSATLDPRWLETVDIEPAVDLGEPRELEPEDREESRARLRLQAPKPLRRSQATMGEAGEIAEEAAKAHKSGTRTLLVVNTVRRAVDIYAALKKAKLAARLVLVHSRFRPGDRKKAVEDLLAEPGERGVIAVCTQVIEAGVDVSARILFTELSPWASLVQRFGRANRTGQEADATVYWIDLPKDEKQRAKLAAPYELERLLSARKMLLDLRDVAPGSLPAVEMPFEHQHVLRRKDLLELFDTTPDLAGHDLDISRFIRESHETDVHIFWRDIPDKHEPSDDEAQPGRSELCAVPIGDLRALIKAKAVAWIWDALGEKWERVAASTPVYPGVTVMLRAADGRYAEKEGWNASLKKPKVPVLVAALDRQDSRYSGEPFSERSWMLLADHTDRVVGEGHGLALVVPPEWRTVLLEAARWHDAGKAHPICQAAFRGPEPSQAPPGVLAKAPHKIRYARRGFRHELASGLLALMHGRDDLVAYLAAAHHGKVRLSLRSLPVEKKPPEAERRFARGVWDGDEVPGADLGGGVILPPAALSLELMELGESDKFGPSWLARMLALRDRSDLGPFRLALLEALLKAADERASGQSVAVEAAP